MLEFAVFVFPSPAFSNHVSLQPPAIMIHLGFAYAGITERAHDEVELVTTLQFSFTLPALITMLLQPL
jgi:hypothetical protein